MSIQFTINNNILNTTTQKKIEDTLIFLLDKAPISKIENLLIHKDDTSSYYLTATKDRNTSTFESICFNIEVSKYEDVVTKTKQGTIRHRVPSHGSGTFIYEPI